MASRWVEISCSLSLCRKVFAILKQKNPDLIPDHVDIIPYRKNSKNCHFHDASRALGIEDNDDEWIAHFDDRGGYGSHVCIKQDVLIFPLTIPSWEEDPDNVPKKQMQFLKGNWAIIEIMCHELTHYIAIGHDKDFFKLYYKFLSQMAQVVVSGEFYYWYSRQHQSKKHSGIQTAETREWVNNYLTWK